MASPGFSVGVGGGHRFGVVKRPKVINVCRTHQAALFTPEYPLLHYACVSFTYNNKMKIHDSLKNYRYRILTKSSADADKTARRV